MRTILTTLFFICIISFNSPADELISKFKFVGEKPAYNLNLYSRPHHPFVIDSLSSDSIKIVKNYKDHGWYDCEVTINHKTKTDGVEIIFRIIKGELYNLYFDTDSLPEKDSLLQSAEYLIDSYNTNPAVASNIKSLADDLIAHYSENGYPYCEVRFNEFRILKPDSLKLLLDIQPGPYVTIDRIVFEGLKNIRPEFLQQYLGLNTPSDYSMSVLETAHRRLSRTEFIAEVDDYKLRYLNRPERGIVVFPIKEVSPLLLDGAAGYSSKDEEFYGKFNAVISNILGKGRQAKLEWAKKDKESRWLKIGFSEPYPLGIPFKMSLEAYQDDRDSTFIENGASFGLHYLGSDIYSYGVSIGVSRLDPDAYGRTFLPYKNKLRLSVSLSADTRDYPQNPRAGEYLYLKADFISETTRGDSLYAASNSNYRTAELYTEKLLRLTNSSVVFISLHALGDFSENVPVDRLFPLGGFGSLRGYMQDQFYVSRKAVVSVEYRLLTSRHGRAYIFSDGAIYQIPKQNDNGSDTDYMAGLGLGLAASVRLGVATIEIAVPTEEGVGDIKLHFGMKAGF